MLVKGATGEPEIQKTMKNEINLYSCRIFLIDIYNIYFFRWFWFLIRAEKILANIRKINPVYPCLYFVEYDNVHAFVGD